SSAHRGGGTGCRGVPRRRPGRGGPGPAAGQHGRRPRRGAVSPREVAAEVRALLRGPAAAPALACLDAARGRGEEPDPRPVYRLLGAHQLLAATWPAAYGGRGLHPRCAAAVTAELVAAGVPDTLHTLSVLICGGFLLGAGAPAQRAWL